ncbi:MAG TPA: type II toxin-antitoxin system RelE/ParE family toxin [bacterium]
MSARPFRLRIAPRIARRIAKLHPDVKRRIRDALVDMARAPDAGKPLRDELTGQWTWRVGRYRVIYRIVPGGIIDIVTVGERRTVYEQARLEPGDDNEV